MQRKPVSPLQALPICQTLTRGMEMQQGTVGYSGTPLAKKLGFKSGMTVTVLDAPEGYRDWLVGLPEGVTLSSSMPAPLTAAHVFLKDRTRLEDVLGKLRDAMVPTGFVWVSWPKKASRVPTDVTEDVIREVALPMGWVDVKVCAVSDIWSGLKLVIRKSERTLT